ncbi:DUF4835 family protein [Capnocytophaga sp.]|uniref:type IX secretion system protein PorD n=1 Tax=Capnocytophaga sp. TaxID=44737 RepID=UPI0026DC1616|nr:DUF4835 family protein [Capnocytophaga sp.]MDO5106612.1 DUF4835 family protein [Capnocytophaga sp.]
MKKYFLLVTLIWGNLLCAQELQSIITINTQQVNVSNKTIFKTLEKSLQEFINQTQWTHLKVRENERIRCNFTLVINKFDSNRFEASLLVQSSRPVFNTSYQTPVLNIQDKEVVFSYQEYEPLTFNANSFHSNLTSVVAYYAYLILGFDANTFAPNGGHPFFEQAQNVVISAQSSGFSGWTDDGKNNRWLLVNELLSENYANYHKAWYGYHRLGLDTMSDNEKTAKEEIQKAVLLLDKVLSLRLNSYAMNLFFNAKTDEIVSIFSGGSIFNTTVLKEVLSKIAPSQTTKWNQIK